MRLEGDLFRGFACVTVTPLPLSPFTRGEAEQSEGSLVHLVKWGRNSLFWLRLNDVYSCPIIALSKAGHCANSNLGSRYDSTEIASHDERGVFRGYPCTQMYGILNCMYLSGEWNPI